MAVQRTVWVDLIDCTGGRTGRCPVGLARTLPSLGVAILHWRGLGAAPQYSGYLYAKSFLCTRGWGACQTDSSPPTTSPIPNSCATRLTLRYPE